MTACHTMSLNEIDAYSAGTSLKRVNGGINGTVFKTVPSH